MGELKILFIGKKDDPLSALAAKVTLEFFPDTVVVWSSKGMKLPDIFKTWSGDYIFSYLAQWVLPQSLLDRARIVSINWHPGPPEYPGIGCTNFAIYNGESEFGITCHEMLSKVDSGALIEVRRFMVLPNESVYSLTQKCYSHIFQSFLSILDHLVLEKPLPTSQEKWQRIPYTRKQLNALCLLTDDMPDEEVYRRVRATKYEKHWAYYLKDGVKILYSDFK